MLLLFAACPMPEPLHTDETPDTGGPGTTPVDPAIAVYRVEATQDGPDVAFAFTAPEGVTRTATATITWAGQTEAAVVALDDGAAVVVRQIPSPCEMLGTAAMVTVRIDGSRWDQVVELEGTVAEATFLAVNPHSGLGAICNEVVVLDGVGHAYELRAASVFVTPDDGYSGTAFASHAVLWLDGRYDVIWRERPHELMVRAVEVP